MPASVGIRDLRNHTSAIVERARLEGEVIITSHGTPVAVIRSLHGAWKLEALRLLHADAEAVDSGLTDLLAADDEMSMNEVG